MKFKDIVNRDLVNLTNCDQEPIHIPGSIQPHGCLFSVNSNTGLIDFVSENIFDFTGHQIKHLIGYNFEDLFPGRTLNQLLKNVESRQESIRLNFPAGTYEVYYHLCNDQLIFELEFNMDESPAPNLINLSGEFVDYIENTTTIQELCDRVAMGIKKVSGYDRVMVYRFDEHYNGEVIAEKKNDDLEAFLGLHYPHTDIPKQARELYLKNQLRVIADVNYIPVAIYTADNGISKNLDLSYSVLRSVSPIHCQYLRNMGVGATLTISLLHKQKLWGLVACHHYSTKTISFEVKMAAKLLGHIITSQLDARQISEQDSIAGKCNAALTRVTGLDFSPQREYLQELADNKDTLQICNASGVAFVFDNTVYQSDYAPEAGFTLELNKRLRETGRGKEMQITSLSALYPDFNAYCETFPGILYFPLNGSGGILWFRHETIKNITWAGDPSKAIEKDASGLSPRKSFEQWKETVKCQSTNWLSAETTAARNFADVIEKFIQSIRVTEERDKQKELSETLTRANSELEIINWISTHDLQEPLRKIRMTASILLDHHKNLPEKVHTMIGKMSEHASYTQSLMKDIQKYSRISGSAERFNQVSLDDILADVQKQIASKLRTRKHQIHIDQLPVIEGIASMLRSVFYNLLENAVHFSDPEKVLKINVKYKGIIDGYQQISVSDNGIGFEPGQSEQLFRVFATLNPEHAHTGRGIGLALCQKIMEKHRGHIRARGNTGEGATFYLSFPAVSTPG